MEQEFLTGGWQMMAEPKFITDIFNEELVSDIQELTN